jgi:hypothetical protein
MILGIELFEGRFSPFLDLFSGLEISGALIPNLTKPRIEPSHFISIRACIETPPVKHTVRIHLKAVARLQESRKADILLGFLDHLPADQALGFSLE